MRARVLSGECDCFAYLHGAHAFTDKERGYLPEWTEERFPHVAWEDRGTYIEKYLESILKRELRNFQYRFYKEAYERENELTARSWLQQMIGQRPPYLNSPPKRHTGYATSARKHS